MKRRFMIIVVAGSLVALVIGLSGRIARATAIPHEALLAGCILVYAILFILLMRVARSRQGARR